MDPDGPDDLSPEDERGARERDFPGASSFELVRSGIPVIFSAGAILAACGGGGHSDKAKKAGAHGDHTDSSQASTTHSDHTDRAHTDTSHATPPTPIRRTATGPIRTRTTTTPTRTATRTTTRTTTECTATQGGSTSTRPTSTRSFATTVTAIRTMTTATAAARSGTTTGTPTPTATMTTTRTPRTVTGGSPSRSSDEFGAPEPAGRQLLAPLVGSAETIRTID